MTAMLIIGNDPTTIKAAKDAIVEVLKAAGTEAASVAAMNTLSELAKAPHNISLSGFTMTNNPAKKKR